MDASTLYTGWNIASGIAGVYADLQAGKVARSQADTEAMIDDYQAQLAQKRGLEEAANIRRVGRKVVGAAAAAYAGAGVKVGEGSAFEVERDITTGYEHDATQATLEGDRRALALRTQAKVVRSWGDYAVKASKINALNTALGSGYRAYSGWKTGAKPGAKPGSQAPTVPDDLKDWWG